MLMRARWFKKVVCSCFILFALLAASTASEGATIYRVKPGNEDGDGSTWDNAMGVGKFRQALIDEQEGEYWLAAGTYKPADVTDDDNPRAKSFVLSDGIALYGALTGGWSESARLREE